MLPLVWRKEGGGGAGAGGEEVGGAESMVVYEIEGERGWGILIVPNGIFFPWKIQGFSRPLPPPTPRKASGDRVALPSHSSPKRRWKLDNILPVQSFSKLP